MREHRVVSVRDSHEGAEGSDVHSEHGDFIRGIQGPRVVYIIAAKPRIMATGHSSGAGRMCRLHLLHLKGLQKSLKLHSGLRTDVTIGFTH